MELERDVGRPPHPQHVRDRSSRNEVARAWSEHDVDHHERHEEAAGGDQDERRIHRCDEGGRTDREDRRHDPGAEMHDLARHGHALGDAVEHGVRRRSLELDLRDGAPHDDATSDAAGSSRHPA